MLNMFTCSPGRANHVHSYPAGPVFPARLAGVLFDMDGTLSDSETLHWGAYRRVFARNPPWRQPRSKLVVSLVNSHANATIICWHLWENYLRFAPGLPPGWSRPTCSIP